MNLNLNLTLKHMFFPGPDLGIRKRMKLVRYFLAGDISTLDAGCGNGAFSLAAYRLGNRVLGINLDADQVRKCTEFASFVGADMSRLSFRVLNIYDIFSLNQRFDQIICFETLEHLLYDQKIVNAFASVLNPGGMLHLCTPNRECLVNDHHDLSLSEDGGHVRIGYTQLELEQLARLAGLEPIIRDACCGLGVQRAVISHRWLAERMHRKVGLQTAASVLSFILLGWLTIGQDKIQGAPPMSIYICARKPTEQTE